MPWTFAPYIPLAEVADKPVGYVWKGDNPLFYYREDSRFEKRLGDICDRGAVALSAACAEWVAARWPRLAEPALVWEIQAVWAGIIDWRYLRPPATVPRAPKEGACSGPEQGCICDAFFTLSNIVDRVQRSAMVLSHCSALSQLAIHVLKNPTTFKAWRRNAIERLRSLYPAKQDALLGPPIPREALNLEYPYDPGSADELLRTFLQQLDPAENPFLRTPQEMRELGFEGTPYDLP